VKRLIASLYDRFVRAAWKFGIVGLVGFFIDVGVYNALRLGALGDGFFSGPLTAKVASVAIATVANWFGNRYWTFREHRRKNFLLELVEFAAVSVAGLGISLVCGFVSHYLLGLHNLIADNIAVNVVGLILGTIFRFVLYRYWVFGHHRKDGLTARKSAEARAAAIAIYEDDTSASRDAAR
jgi:putative flippase GtrA